VLLFREQTPEKVAQLIGPHQKASIICAFPISQIEQIHKGQGYGYLLGEIDYNDRLDTSVAHKTQFTLAMTINRYVPGTLSFNGDEPVGTRPIVEMQFNPVGLHNCADEDCPSQ